MAIHLDHTKADPTAYRALLELGKTIDDNDIDPKLRHLIDIRASQVNGCAFCLDMHVREAQHAGETEQRLFAVPTWHDTPFFSPAERAVLALTEHVTKISNGGVPDELEAPLREHFSELQIVKILMMIIRINAWNRLAISTGMQPKVR